MAQQSTSDIAYSRESEIINHFRTIAAKTETDPAQTAEALKDLTSHYERLLDDSKLLTSVGDRLQKKLKSANLMLREQAEEIKRANTAIQEKNVELQNTIDELTRAKASRRATTLLLLVAVGLFLVAEIPEPLVEAYFSRFSWGGAAVWVIKGSIALLLAPLQSFIEGQVLKQMTRRQQRERLAAQAAAGNVPPATPSAGTEGPEGRPRPARRPGMPEAARPKPAEATAEVKVEATATAPTEAS